MEKSQVSSSLIHHRVAISPSARYSSSTSPFAQQKGALSFFFGQQTAVPGGQHPHGKKYTTAVFREKNHHPAALKPRQIACARGCVIATCLAGRSLLTWTLSSSLTICSCSFPTSDRTRTAARKVSTCERPRQKKQRTKRRGEFSCALLLYRCKRSEICSGEAKLVVRGAQQRDLSLRSASMYLDSARKRAIRDSGCAQAKEAWAR